MGTQHSLAAISLEMERQKRDAQSRQEQDRVGQLCVSGRLSPRLWGRGMALPWGRLLAVGELQPFLGSPHQREEA